MSEIASQSYTLFPIPGPRPGQSLVHVHPDARELNRVYRADLGVNTSPRAFAQALDDLQPATEPQRAALLDGLRASYRKWSDPTVIEHPGKLQMGQVMAYLGRTLPDNAILCNGAGNFATWIHRFHPFAQYGTQLAPTSGSMGYGLPAAVAAKRIHPDKPVICFAGDGCFMMHGQEFATAVQYRLPIIVVIVDNGMYGTIRMHQEMHYPARLSATALQNPDFSAYARAFGGHGERVETSEEFAPAFERACASGKPAILHCLIDPETITPTTTLTALRERALAAKA